MTIDRAYELAKQILTEAQSGVERIRSEADTKLQIITRLVTDVLGWSHGDVASESPNENGFSDYLIKDGDHPALVIEAKRIGEIEVGTQAVTKGYYKLSGPVLKSASAGLKQVWFRARVRNRRGCVFSLSFARSREAFFACRGPRTYR
jgi:hypothetical protein